MSTTARTMLTAMTRSHRPQLAATPADLPAGHLESYVWQFCAREGFHLHTPLEKFRVTCTPEDMVARRQGPDRAVRDSSGMYHLMGGERSFCLGEFNRSDWCTSQTRGSTEFTLDVSDVPLADRCYRARGRWPAAPAGNTALARIRRQLVATFGPGCAVCPDPWASKVDHDHITGEVRGYLCDSCNAAITECRHLHGCRFISYLREPRARKLGLVYPRHATLSAQPAQVARRACYDRVMAGGVSPGAEALLVACAAAADAWAEAAEGPADAADGLADTPTEPVSRLESMPADQDTSTRLRSCAQVRPDKAEGPERFRGG